MLALATPVVGGDVRGEKLVVQAGEGDDFREASWDEALDLVADKFKEIIAESGPDALAGVSCARSINEDSYQMQKLFRAVIGTNNIDHCART
jgi:formate dehydrogenase major subunit